MHIVTAEELRRVPPPKPFTQLYVTGDISNYAAYYRCEGCGEVIRTHEGGPIPVCWSGRITCGSFRLSWAI